MPISDKAYDDLLFLFDFFQLIVRINTHRKEKNNEQMKYYLNKNVCGKGIGGLSEKEKYKKDQTNEIENIKCKTGLKKFCVFLIIPKFSI